MSHRQNIEKSIENYKKLTIKLEERIKDIVSSVMDKRNYLKQELVAKNVLIREFEAKNSQAENTIAILREQLCATKEKFTQADYFAEGVFDIAKKLAYDETQIDATDYSIQNPPSPPAEQKYEPNNQQDDSQVPVTEIGQYIQLNEYGVEIKTERNSV